MLADSVARLNRRPSRVEAPDNYAPFDHRHQTPIGLSTPFCPSLSLTWAIRRFGATMKRLYHVQGITIRQRPPGAAADRRQEEHYAQRRVDPASVDPVAMRASHACVAPLGLALVTDGPTRHPRAGLHNAFPPTPYPCCDQRCPDTRKTPRSPDAPFRRPLRADGAGSRAGPVHSHPPAARQWLCRRCRSSQRAAVLGSGGTAGRRRHHPHDRVASRRTRS